MAGRVSSCRPVARSCSCAQPARLHLACRPTDIGQVTAGPAQPAAEPGTLAPMRRTTPPTAPPMMAPRGTLLLEEDEGEG